MAKTKALDATVAIKRGSNILAILKAEATQLGANIRAKVGELSDAKIILAETLRDRIVAKEICAHEGKDAKKLNQAEANQYVRWAYPDLKTADSANVRTSELLSFAKPHIVEHTPDYRGVFATWCAATTSKERGGKDYFGSCVKLNNFVAKHELTGKLTPAQFKAAHDKSPPKAKSAEQQAKADAKARLEARDAIIDAAKMLCTDKSVHKDIKDQLRDIIKAISGKTGIAK